MRINVDASRCVASGMCAFAAPTVFDQRETDGVVVVLREAPAESEHEQVHLAAQSCPVQVISLE